MHHNLQALQKITSHGGPATTIKTEKTKINQRILRTIVAKIILGVPNPTVWRIRDVYDSDNI
jgi:hypothetical protein